MFIVPNEETMKCFNIDRFVERKTLESSPHSNKKIKKQMFLFIDANVFDRENSKNQMNFCYLNVFLVSIFLKFFIMFIDLF